MREAEIANSNKPEYKMTYEVDVGFKFQQRSTMLIGRSFSFFFTVNFTITSIFNFIYHYFFISLAF